MKINLYHWSEPNGPFKIKDRLQMRLSQPTAVYASKDGVEIQVGYGTYIDVQISGEFEVTFDPVADLRVFVSTPPQYNYRPSGEVFTNVDRQAHESGAVLEVRKALREFQIEQYHARQEGVATLREIKRQGKMLASAKAEQQAALDAQKEAQAPTPAEDLEQEPQPPAE